MNYTYIYALSDPRTNEIRYVGKANNPKRRYYAHMRIDKTASNHKVNWVQSLLNIGLKPELIVLEKVSISEWKAKERFYINKYRKKYKLTNYKDGGEGLGFRGNQTSFKKGLTPWNAGTRKKKRCLVCGELFEVSPTGDLKYKCCSMECSVVYRSRHPNSGCFKKGHKSWNKGRKGYSTSKKGSGVSLEVRREISDTLKGRTNGGASKKVVQKDRVTGTLLAKFPSAAEASRQTGISASSIINNLNSYSRTAGGFKWEKA
jgi:hypothetical protein